MGHGSRLDFSIFLRILDDAHRIDPEVLYPHRTSDAQRVLTSSRNDIKWYAIQKIRQHVLRRTASGPAVAPAMAQTSLSDWLLDHVSACLDELFHVNVNAFCGNEPRNLTFVAKLVVGNAVL